MLEPDEGPGRVGIHKVLEIVYLYKKWRCRIPENVKLGGIVSGRLSEAEQNKND